MTIIQVHPLHQTRTINKYIHDWEVITTRLHNLTDDQLLKMYILGLKPNIHNELRLSRPKNLVESRDMKKRLKGSSLVNKR